MGGGQSGHAAAARSRPSGSSGVRKRSEAADDSKAGESADTDGSAKARWNRIKGVVRVANSFKRAADDALDALHDAQRHQLLMGAKMLVEDDSLSEGRLSRKYRETDKVLGSGAFATVKLCHLRSFKDEYRALKVVHKNHPDAAGERLLNDEIRAMRRIAGHVGVITCYDIYETASSVYVVLELATGGTLLDHVLEAWNSGKQFSEADASDAIRQLADAVHFIHSMGVVHRDIKPDNILLREKDSFIIKLTDFGLAHMASLRGRARASFNSTKKFADEHVVEMKDDDGGILAPVLGPVKEVGKVIGDTRVGQVIGDALAKPTQMIGDAIGDALDDIGETLNGGLTSSRHNSSADVPAVISHDRKLSNVSHLRSPNKASNMGALSMNQEDMSMTKVATLHAAGTESKQRGREDSSKQVIGGDRRIVMNISAGSPLYAAPEVMACQPYDQSCDVWCIGVTLAILVSGEPPWSCLPDDPAERLKAQMGNAMIKTMNKGNSASGLGQWKGVSDAAKALISKTMVYPAKARLAPVEIRQDPWCKPRDDGGVAPIAPLTQTISGFAKLRREGVEKLVREMLLVQSENLALIRVTLGAAELDVELGERVVRRAELYKRGLIGGGASRDVQMSSSGRAALLDISSIFDALLESDEANPARAKAEAEIDIRVRATVLEAALRKHHAAVVRVRLEPLFNDLDKDGAGDVTFEDVAACIRTMAESSASSNASDAPSKRDLGGEPEGENSVSASDTSAIRALVERCVAMGRTMEQRTSTSALNLDEFLKLMGAIEISTVTGADGKRQRRISVGATANLAMMVNEATSNLRPGSSPVGNDSAHAPLRSKDESKDEVEIRGAGSPMVVNDDAARAQLRSKDEIEIRGAGPTSASGGLVLPASNDVM